MFVKNTNGEFVNLDKVYEISWRFSCMSDFIGEIRLHTTTRSIKFVYNTQPDFDRAFCSLKEKLYLVKSGWIEVLNFMFRADCVECIYDEDDHIVVVLTDNTTKNFFVTDSERETIKSHIQKSLDRQYLFNFV